jgi:hypothetical protein
LENIEDNDHRTLLQEFVDRLEKLGKQTQEVPVGE